MSDDRGTYTAYGATNHVIYPEEVDALLFVKYIPDSLDEIVEIPPEEQYYIVTLK